MLTTLQANRDKWSSNCRLYRTVAHCLLQVLRAPTSVTLSSPNPVFPKQHIINITYNHQQQRQERPQQQRHNHNNNNDSNNHNDNNNKNDNKNEDNNNNKHGDSNDDEEDRRRRRRRQRRRRRRRRRRPQQQQQQQEQQESGKTYLKSPNWIAHTLLELPFNCGDYQHLASGSEWLFRTAAGMTILNPGCLMTYSQWGAVIIHISQGWILFDAAVRLNGVGFGFQGLKDHHAGVALRWTSFSWVSARTCFSNN